MSRRLTTGLLAAGIMIGLPIVAGQPSRAESAAKNTHLPTKRCTTAGRHARGIPGAWSHCRAQQRMAT